MINIIPRPFQATAPEKIKESNSNRILLSAPTGGGKAILLMMLANQYLSQNKKVLLLVDRIVLIDQLSSTANDCGLPHNILHGVTSTFIHNFTIGSIQTLCKRNEIYNLNDWDVILIDEAHTIYKEMEALLKPFRGCKIGASATPFTKGLKFNYDTLITLTTAHELTKQGFLVPLVPYTFRKINMEGANTVGGEWAANEAHKRSREIYGDVVDTYIKCVKGLRSICFCATIAHCKDVADKFTKAGIPVGIYSAYTRKKKRRKLLEDFDNKKIWILISVAALAKGFDKPYIECILDLRPLRRSLLDYTQMIGRGLRSCEGKKECYLLDFTGNIDRFLPDYEDIFFNGVPSLDESDRLNRIRSNTESKKAIKCPSCDNPFMIHKCTNCGYERILEVNIPKVDIENIHLKAVECFQNAPKVDIPPLPTRNASNRPKRGFFQLLRDIF